MRYAAKDGHVTWRTRPIGKTLYRNKGNLVAISYGDLTHVNKNWMKKLRCCVCGTRHEARRAVFVQDTHKQRFLPLCQECLPPKPKSAKSKLLQEAVMRTFQKTVGEG